MIETAEQAEPGLGSEYDKSLKSYGTAKRIEGVKEAGKKLIKRVAIPAAVGAAAGGAGYKIARSLGE